MHRTVLLTTSLLAIVLTAIASPASADIIIGEPDNSYISYFVAPMQPTPETHETYRDYSSPTVSGSGVSKVPDFPEINFYGGTNTWDFDASLVDGAMRARLTGTSGIQFDDLGNSQIYPTQVQVLLALNDRVYIDQEITDPITVTVTLAVDGVMSGPSDGGVQVLSSLRSFVDPFTDGVAYDVYNSVNFGAHDFLLTEDVFLLPGQQWFDIESTLHLIMNSSWLTTFTVTAQDFGHTALLDIILPEGLTYQTEGGFTGRVTAVPEPTTLALFGIGLIGLLALRRHQRPDRQISDRAR